MWKRHLLTQEDRRHLSPWIRYMAIDPQLLDEIMADARRHHPEEEDLDLRQRAVYRYAHLHSWHWKKYLLEALFAGAASIGFLVLLVWFLIHHG